MSRKPQVTLHVFPAVRAAKAVVIRRGPSKWWHFLLWDLDTGIVQPGSWFSGMVYPQRCDFSPRGDSFLMVAYKGTNTPVAWSLLCKPPSVRAEVFWAQDTAALGGGIFDQRLPIVWVNFRPDRNPVELRAKTPYDFGFLDEEHKGYGGFPERLSRDGWTREDGGSDEMARWSIQIPRTHTSIVVEFPAAQCVTPVTAPPQADPEPIVYSLRHAGNPAQRMEGVTWAGWNSKSQLCMARDGVLMSATVKEGDLMPTIVLDLNATTPPTERVLRETRTRG